MEVQNKGPENAGTTGEQRANVQNTFSVCRHCGADDLCLWFGLHPDANEAPCAAQQEDDENTKAAQWLDLAERCEKATGLDRKIEEVIFVALGRLPYSPWIGDITASLDAITALIERELPGMRWLCRSDVKGGTGIVYPKPIAGLSAATPTWAADAATPALALCAAFAKAMADKESRS